MTHAPMSEEQRAEAFREFHAEHLRRQTKSLDTIRTIMVVWMLLTVLGIVVLLAASASSSSSGF